MASKDQSILAQVAFKAAIEVVCNTEYAETDDIVGETFALTSAFYENLDAFIGKLGGSAKPSGSPKKSGSKPSSGGSNKPGSTQQSGKKAFTIKNPDAPATEGQWRKLESVGYDLGELDDNLTMGEANDLIQSAL